MYVTVWEVWRPKAFRESCLFWLWQSQKEFFGGGKPPRTPTELSSSEEPCLRAVGTGKTTRAPLYHRTFEPGVAPEQTFSVEVS